MCLDTTKVEGNLSQKVNITPISSPKVIAKLSFSKMPVITENVISEDSEDEGLNHRSHSIKVIKPLNQK